MKINKGDVFCLLGKVKRFHMFTYVREYKGRLLFFDIHTGEIFLLNYSTVERALNKETNHPVHPDLKMFDFVEQLPHDVFNVIEADTELKLKEKEPDILNLF
jgi:hypothetical protein